MDAAEFRSELAGLGIRQTWLADRMGVHPTTVSRWATGDLPSIPGYVPFVLQLLRERRSDQAVIKDAVATMVEAAMALPQAEREAALRALPTRIRAMPGPEFRGTEKK